MRKPFKAKKLARVFTEGRDAFFLHDLSGFVLHKKWDLQQPLTDVESTFYLIDRLGSAIVGDGWDSVFMQAYTYSELQRIIDAFRGEIPLPSFADRLDRARAIYYLHRTDLDRPDSLWIKNNVFAHLTNKQYDKMIALGEGVADEGGELPQLQPLLAAWCRQNRNGFLETKAS